MDSDILKAEVWRPIPKWEGLYEVSDQGRVRSLTRWVKGRQGLTQYQGRVLKPGYGAKYALVTLAETGRGRRQQFYVHDLVLLVFVGPKPAGQEVCHGPTGRTDNTLVNLRYDTRSANAQDRHLFGIGWKKRGRKPPTSVSCQICGVEVLVWRRRTSRHICSDPFCRSAWGKTWRLAS